MKKGSKFVHLHTHTEYSLLDGLSNIKKLVAYTKENHMDSIAISDHGVMYGAIEFYKVANKQGVKPIIGMEAYTTNVDHKKRLQRGKYKNFHLLLLAKNYEGYQNLMKLSSIAHLEGYLYRPRFDRKTLAKYSKGLIATSACPQGEVAQALIAGDHKEAKKIVKWFYDVFGKDYYLELQKHDYKKYAESIEIPELKREVNAMAVKQDVVWKGKLKLSREFGIPVIATNDAHYIRKSDANSQDALVCIATGKNVSDVKRLRFIDVPDYFVKTPDEMSKEFSELPEAIDNTVKIADKCNVEIQLGKWFFPNFELPKGKTPEEVLTEMTFERLKEKYGKITKKIKKRADFELDIINSKGYAAYFLIYEDMSSWAYKRSIPINTRGSVAGSIVSYALGITTVDPLYYQLPFERFLNPLRPKAPDIDMDIADDKREDMLAYLVKKYGKDKVAQICTFGRMLAKASVRDVARVLGYPYATGDRIAKVIPLGAQGFPMTINRALDESPDFKNMYGSDPDVKKIVDLAKGLEGSARHISVHAAGVVISPKALMEFSPLQLEPKGEKIITQYEMNSAEDVGLVKLDVLGIRNLAILRGAVKNVNETRKKVIDITKIPLDDKKTYDMLARGETMGTFQLGGSGMTRYIVELKPERIEDIMAMIALYRPGPLAIIPEYIARKKGERPVKYFHPKMEKFLDKSFGLLVYQDDLMSTALELAGYTWLTVDKLRKAVGKKIPEEMAEQKKIFIKGCMKHSGMSKERSTKLWDLFEPFQGYGFNKAHAASYGVVAYQTCYMKANYPVEYMAALLTAESGNTDKIAQAIGECKRIGITILPPNINASDTGFTIVKDKNSLDEMAIRFGLEAVKNVGTAAIEVVLAARKDGKFASFADFVQRVDNRKVNKKVMESLIKVGAMSEFGNRASLMDSFDEIRAKAAKPKSTSEGQQGLFSVEEVLKASETSVEIAQLPEYSDEELENLERALLGFSLSAKPLGELLAGFHVRATHRIDELNHASSEIVKVAGIINDMRVVTTKKSGQEMSFVTLEDETGTISLVVFPKIYKKFKSLLVDNTPLLVEGKLDAREDETSILVDNIETESSEDNLFVKIPKGAGASELRLLRKILLNTPGSQKVTLIFEENGGKKIDLPYKIDWSEVLAKKIAEVFKTDRLDG